MSPVVAARRALDLGLIDRTTFFDFYECYVSRERKGDTYSSGGDFYNNQNTRVGELFASQVLRAAMEGRIGFKEAYDLTGLRGGTFQKYAKRLGPKSARRWVYTSRSGRSTISTSPWTGYCDA